MIPMMNIVAWGNVVPWGEQRQVEQDLIISRTIVDLSADPLLREQLRFRGGTALNKLHSPSPVRYSEDIDLGRGNFEQSQVAPKLRFRAQAEDPAAQIRLKVEINTWEIEAYDAPQAIPFRVDNPWFAGNAEIATFSREEMLATKLRALLQRNKGRDLFDLDHAFTVFEGLNTARIVECFLLYLEKTEQTISKAEAQQRMFQKLVNPTFFIDMRPLLSTDRTKALTNE